MFIPGVASPGFRASGASAPGGDARRFDPHHQPVPNRAVDNLWPAEADSRPLDGHSGGEAWSPLGSGHVHWTHRSDGQNHRDRALSFRSATGLGRRGVGLPARSWCIDRGQRVPPDRRRVPGRSPWIRCDSKVVGDDHARRPRRRRIGQPRTGGDARHPAGRAPRSGPCRWGRRGGWNRRWRRLAGPHRGAGGRS